MSQSSLVFNAILATDRKNGIGINTTLPWKLDKEFEHYMNATHYRSADHEKENKKHLMVCGPQVFKDYYCLAPHNQNFLWALVSRTVTEKPENCDILTNDYTLSELVNIIESEEYKNKIGNIIVIGGVGLYNTVMSESFAHKCRFFWTRVDSEFEVDRRVEQLNMNKWTEVTGKDRVIEGFPSLPEKTTEVDNATGKPLSWYVHVFENFQNFQTQNGTDFRRGA